MRSAVGNWKNNGWGSQVVELAANDDQWHWAKQPSGSISLPDFIQLRAKGEATVINGHVFLKKPGPDPEIQALLVKRMNDAYDAYKVMQESMTKSLYEGNEAITKCTGLAGLLKDE